MQLLALGKLVGTLEECGNSVRAVHPSDAVRGFLRVDSDGGHEERRFAVAAQDFDSRGGVEAGLGDADDGSARRQMLAEMPAEARLFVEADVAVNDEGLERL